MIKLCKKYGNATLDGIRALYEDAFPKNEKKPFELIIRKCREGQMDILAVTNEEDELLGLAITVLHGDIVLLDYFAILPDKRGLGVGTSALEMLKKRYTGRRLLLEIEDDAVPADNTAERIRRRKFYLGCGMTVMPYRVSLFGVEMLILTYGGEVSFPEYHGIFGSVFSEWAAKNVWQIT